MDIHELQWTRHTSTETDERGHRVTTVATGWPQTARGDWQDKDGRSIQQGEGRSINRDAVFYSESWLLGLVGDTAVSPTGVAFVCVGVKPNLGDGGRTDHVEYVMQKHNPTGEALG